MVHADSMSLHFILLIWLFILLSFHLLFSDEHLTTTVFSSFDNVQAHIQQMDQFLLGKCAKIKLLPRRLFMQPLAQAKLLSRCVYSAFVVFAHSILKRTENILQLYSVLINQIYYGNLGDSMKWFMSFCISLCERTTSLVDSLDNHSFHFHLIQSTGLFFCWGVNNGI